MCGRVSGCDREVGVAVTEGGEYGKRKVGVAG